MSVITMKSLQQKLIKSIVTDIESVGKPWKRLTELNNLLKGFRPREFTVLRGKTGTGKTTFMSEYSLDLAESGVKTLWGSFEISILKLSKILLSQYKRKSLSNLKPVVIEQMIEDFHKMIPIQFINIHGEQDFKELFQIMTKAHKEQNFEHIILDNLQFMVGVYGSSMSEKMHAQDRFVGEIRKFVNNTNVHVTLIAHPRKENSSEILTINSLYGGCKLSQEADNILLLQTLESQNKKYLQIVKNREFGSMGTMQLKFNTESLTFNSPKYKTKCTPLKNPDIIITDKLLNLPDIQN